MTQNLNFKGTQLLEPTLWRDILHQTSAKNEFEDCHLLVFGDKNSGKKSIIKSISKKLLNNEETDCSRIIILDKRTLYRDDTPSKTALIDYTYLNMKKLNDVESENYAKMRVMMINDLLDKQLFQTVFKPEFLSKTVCMIVVDLSRVMIKLTQPWSIIESLRKWCNYIYDNLGAMMLNLPCEKQVELRENIENYIKLYEEPKKDEEGNLKVEQLSEEKILFKKSIRIKEGLLRTNIGIPLIFAINKSDVVNSKSERKRFEVDSEFIFTHIRNLALTYGATTIYTSAKENSNLNVLYDYITHRVYQFDLEYLANSVDHDRYFIPSGYDSSLVLKGFDLNDDLSTIFTDRVPAPVNKKDKNTETEVTCEDLQTFLVKCKSGITNTRRIRNFYSSELNNNTSSSSLAVVPSDSNDITRPENHTRIRTGEPNFAQFLNNRGSRTRIIEQISTRENNLVDNEGERKREDDVLNREERPKNSELTKKIEAFRKQINKGKQRKDANSKPQN